MSPGRARFRLHVDVLSRIGGAEATRGTRAEESFLGEPSPRTAMLVGGLFVLVTTAVLIVWAVIAVAHVDDTYLTTHVSGTRMALARYLDHGVLYPPIFDGVHYGGTRIMPLSILTHTAAAKLTGDYLFSGKLVSYSMLAAVLVVVGVVLRRFRCPMPVILILVVSLLVTDPGYRTGFAMLGDTLPVLLGLLGLLIVVEVRRTGGAIGAAVLCALALMAKLSALWAPLAIVVWMLASNKRRLPVFLAAYFACVTALMVVFNVVSSGRFFDNVFGFSLAGVGGPSGAIDAPNHLVRILFFNSPVLWALVPVALLAVGVSFARRHASIYDVALVCHIPLLLVVFTDIGADWNHLIDLHVLSVIVIGHAAAAVERSKGREPGGPWGRLSLPQAAAGLLFVWIVATQLVILLPDLHTAVDSLRSRDRGAGHPLEGRIDPGAKILSEDPFIPVALDRTPVVADPFMLPRIAKRDPEAVQGLVRRIESKEFDFVILSFPLDRDWWWADYHFGTNVIQAVGRAYEFSGREDGYLVYEPAP